MTGNLPLISVLVCNYNYNQYIEEALESILEQDYKNIEIVIVDDGSKDDSIATIESYISNHANVNFSFKKKSKNEGLCYARNDAIELATGEYFVFLDSDDTMPTGYITTLYKTALSNNADVVYSDVKYFGNESGESNAPEYDLDELLTHNYINISALVKKSKIKGHKFDTVLNRKTLEDYDFWMGLSLMGLKFVKARVYLNYRIQGDSRNENDATIETRALTFIEIWHYSIQKYKKMFPKKIKENIFVSELEYQIKSIGHELIRLNKVVQTELVPELKHRGDHIQHLNEVIEQLENSTEYKLGSKILTPARKIKHKLSK